MKLAHILQTIVKKMCERMKPSEKEKKKTENQTPAV